MAQDDVMKKGPMKGTMKKGGGERINGDSEVEWGMVSMPTGDRKVSFEAHWGGLKEQGTPSARRGGDARSRGTSTETWQAEKENGRPSGLQLVLARVEENLKRGGGVHNTEEYRLTIRRCGTWISEN